MEPRLSRRSFIRWVICAGAAASMPAPLRAALEKAGRGRTPRLSSESFAVCHDVRDGTALPDPAPTLKCDVIVVGGGPSGLAAADRLAGADFLLLEKEPVVGGNCTSDEWEGLRFGTGAAWCSLFTPEVEKLFKRWKFKLLPIQGYDAVSFDGVWIDDFWTGRPDNPALDKLPYPESVKGGFRKFAADIQALDLAKEKDRLDQLSFAAFLKDYPPQLAAFWDAFGPSNWGAKTGDTSAYAGLSCARDWPKDQRYSFEGGLGVGAQRIYDQLPASDKRRVRTGAAVYRVRRGSQGAVVSWFEGGKARAAQAKAVVMAAPKYMARRLVEGIPQAQSSAMAAMRYAPYLMVNLCFDRAVWDLAYDNYPVGARAFTDFIPADFVRVGGG
ncbi:MAG: FAD-dependent oxidoreductase, partial [Elusimicrobia bacterium]|nr:FAD-dependent oxidoreductase [Elusimicrobiota bacterium]